MYSVYFSKKICNTTGILIYDSVLYGVSLSYMVYSLLQKASSSDNEEASEV